MPTEVVDEALALLKQRIEGPDETEIGKERGRLEGVRRRLAEVYVAGDLPKSEFEERKRAVDEQDSLPLDASRAARVREFDKARKRLLGYADTRSGGVEQANSRQRQELDAGLVQRVLAKEREVVSLEWRPEAAPFFRRVGEESVLLERAVWDSNPRHED